jgi:hypothetical protein
LRQKIRALAIGGVIHGIPGLCDGRFELLRERRLIFNDKNSHINLSLVYSTLEPERNLNIPFRFRSAAPAYNVKAHIKRENNGTAQSKTNNGLGAGDGPLIWLVGDGRQFSASLHASRRPVREAIGYE